MGVTGHAGRSARLNLACNTAPKWWGRLAKPIAWHIRYGASSLSLFFHMLKSLMTGNVSEEVEYWIPFDERHEVHIMKWNSPPRNSHFISSQWVI